MIHLKKPQRSAEEDDRSIRETVEGMLADVQSLLDTSTEDEDVFDQFIRMRAQAEEKNRLVKVAQEQLQSEKEGKS